ncbi:MAG: hypothetical protein ACLFT7_07305 [Thermoplasmata archaeon]
MHIITPGQKNTTAKDAGVLDLRKKTAVPIIMKEINTAVKSTSVRKGSVYVLEKVGDRFITTPKLQDAKRKSISSRPVIVFLSRSRGSSSTKI